MTTAGSFDAPIEIFGGLVIDMSPADLPHGVSPDCQDVIFTATRLPTTMIGYLDVNGDACVDVVVTNPLGWNKSLKCMNA